MLTMGQIHKLVGSLGEDKNLLLAIAEKDPTFYDHELKDWPQSVLLALAADRIKLAVLEEQQDMLEAETALSIKLESIAQTAPGQFIIIESGDSLSATPLKEYCHGIAVSMERKRAQVRQECELSAGPYQKCTMLDGRSVLRNIDTGDHFVV